MTPDRQAHVEQNALALVEALEARVARQKAELARLNQSLASVRADRDRLAQAIRAHRAQKADDRCIEDDDRLYAALNDGIPCDRRVGDRAAMLANCARFIDRRCQGGHWPSYVDLEADRDRLRDALRTVWETADDELRRLGAVPGSSVSQIEADARAALAASGVSASPPPP